jgi:hypothetical protein
MRRLLIAATLVAALAPTARAQQTRAELLQAASAAYDDFARDRALSLLTAAANPALGPTDTAWVRGIHLMVQILGEGGGGGNENLANTWARWAARIKPDMAIDTVNFVAGVVSALREAKAITSARSSGDAVTATSWRWVARGSSETRGRIVVDAAGMAVPVNVRVVGGGLVPTGTGLSLNPGSYEIEAAASGYLPARLTREVLPGVTTVLNFTLTSASVASDVFPEAARQRAHQNVAALSVNRFGVPAACVAGAFVSRDGLVLTTYEAVRGADSLSNLTGQNIRIAAYDVAANLAVLQIPGARPDSLALATTIADGQSAWGFQFTDCRTPTDVRVRVAEWTDRPRGALQLSDAPLGAAPGSPLVDVAGRVTGIWTGAESAVPSTRAAALLEAARRNIAQSQVLATRAISRRENHAYGSVLVAVDVAGAAARISPMEAWHWTALQSAGNTPFNFAGPMGRYRLEVTAPGNLRREQEFTIRPGENQRIMVALRSVAAAPNTPATVIPKKRSKMPWILGAVGGGGALAALALMGGGGGGGGGGGRTTGDISISVPNP